MVWQQQQTHKQPEYKQLRIEKPGFGGLNIKDLDFMLKPQESPKMKNMMVKDGIFKKRYGQKKLADIAGKWNPYYWNHDKETGYNWNHIVVDDNDNIYVLHEYNGNFELVPVPTGISYGVEPPSSYFIGDDIDLTGVTVLANYSDGSTKDITAESTFAPADGTPVDEGGEFPQVATWTFSVEV